MKFIYTILLTVALMLFVSCTEEDLTPTTGKGVTLVVPLSIVGEQPIADDMLTRTPSDPGHDDKLPYARHLYFWVCLKTSSDKVAVFFRHYDGKDNPEYSWSENNGFYSMTFSVSLPETDVTSTVEPVGRVYAIASTRIISDDELHGIYGGIEETDYGKGYYIERGVTSTIYNLLDNAVFSPAPALTSDDLRDLYSTISSENDIYVTVLDSESKASQVSTRDNAPIKLYHSAAKADFQWHSAYTDISVNSIKITNIPATCKIFQPTANADGAGTVTIDATSPKSGTKWSGRDYVYVFQPSSTLTYEVEFDGKADVTGKVSPPAAVGNFTTWYRIRATINP